MTVSIIIAVKTWQKNLEECVGKCLELDYPDFEIIILPDQPFERQGLFPKPACRTGRGAVPVSVIATGPVTPAAKRDIALTYAKGEILAFLDDDAFPRKDWLKNAVALFKDPEVAAVGGPAITPPGDSLTQKASGQVYASFIVSGNFVYRYIPRKRREVDDYPSCNLLVRKSVMQELGGFDTHFWPGEDTKLCLDITKKLKKKIVYDPDVLAWHHRRRLYGAHLKQIINYALHRGYFVKKYPETSLRLSYFIPTIFVAGLLCGGIASLFSATLRFVYLGGLALYFLIVCASSFSKNLLLIPLVFFGTVVTHIAYGIYFIKGLLAKKLPEEK